MTPIPLEAKLLREIEDVTGLSFRRMGGIDTRDPAIALAVLPVVLSAVAYSGNDVNFRRAVYSLFNTPHAKPYTGEIISWWAAEADELASGVLTQALAAVLDSGSALRVWNLCKEGFRRPFHFLLLSRLASFDVVESEVKQELLRVLNTETLTPGDLSYIAKVGDTRIRSWFGTQLRKPNVKAMATQRAQSRPELPRGIVRSSKPPDRRNEVFSTEEDLANVPKLLGQLARDYGLQVPPGIHSGEFLSRVDTGDWLFSCVPTKNNATVEIWFRLEDIDTVELVLLRKPLDVAHLN